MKNFCVLLCCLFLLSGCAVEGATADTEIKRPTYSENEYNIDDNCVWQSNLTRTGEFNESRYLSVEIIRDYSRYSQLISDTRENVESATEEGQYLIRIGDSWDSVPENFPEKLSLFQKMDETLFEDYDLLMVDFLIQDTIQLEAEPESIQIRNGCATVCMEYTKNVTSTSDNCGVLYFFRIPKGCTEAAVDLVLNEADSILQAGPGF